MPQSYFGDIFHWHIFCLVLSSPRKKAWIARKVG